MQNFKISLGTIPRSFVSGEGKFVFVLQTFTKKLSNTAMQNSQILRGQYPEPGERKVCVRSPKMHQNSSTEMQS